MTNEEPSTDVLDMFLTGAAARTEHYEMAAYTGLIRWQRRSARPTPPTCSVRT